MYLSIPRTTDQELDDTRLLLNAFTTEFQEFLTKTGQYHDGIEMTAHLRRFIHGTRGALVPREVVLKLMQKDCTAPNEVLKNVQDKLDFFIDQTAVHREDPFRQLRDVHLLAQRMVVFNAMLFGVEKAALASPDDVLGSRSYADFIFSYYESQCEKALRKIRPLLKKQKIDPNCFTLEMDLYDSAGPNASACIAIYNIILDGNLTYSKRSLVEATIWAVVRPLENYVELASSYINQIGKEVGNGN